MTYDDKIEVCNGNIIHSTTTSVNNYQEKVTFGGILKLL